MAAAAPPGNLVARSPRRDRLLFVAILALMLLLSPRLRVYYRVTVVDVAVERVSPDGRVAVPLPTPPTFKRPGQGYWRGHTVMARIEPRIGRFMERSDWSREAEPGTRFVWTVRWSDDSPRLDQMGRIVWEAPDVGTRD